MLKYSDEFKETPYVREITLHYKSIGKIPVQVMEPECVGIIFHQVIKTWAVESMVGFCLDPQNKIISTFLLSQGTVNQTSAYPRDLFRHAIACNAAYVLIAHNHPSGSLQCSRADINVTQKIKEGGELIGIPLVDSIIFVKDDNGIISHRSIKDETLPG